MNYSIERYQSESDWLAARLKGIGASEAAAVVNRSRWCSPFALYVRKLEQRIVDDEAAELGQPPDAKEMGKRLEPVIVELFRDCGPGLEPFQSFGKREPFTIFRSKEREHISCTIDQAIVGPNGNLESVLECKCAYFDAFKVWKERVPLSYLLQCQVTMYVTGLESMFIAVLGNGLEFKWHPVARDQSLIDKLLPRLDAFWRHVQERNPPAVDGSQSTTDALRQVHGDGEPDVTVELDLEFVDKLDQLDAAEQAASKATAGVDQIKNEIRDALGVATVAVLPDGSRITWKTDARGARVLRRKRPTLKGSAA